MATTKDLALYTFWLRFWNEVDFGEVIVESDSWAQLEECYGKEKIEAAVKKEWLEVYEDGDDEPVKEFPPEEEGDDYKTFTLEVDVDNMVEAAQTILMKSDWRGNYEEELEALDYKFDIFDE